MRTLEVYSHVGSSIEIQRIGIDRVNDNSLGGDVDFQWEGDTDPYLLYMNAGNDRVGIGTNTPAVKLEVEGTQAAVRITDSTSHVQIGTINATNQGVVTFADVTHLDVNFAAIDTDIKVRGTGDANLVYVDAGNDRVGIGTAAPNVKLEVEGTQAAVRITDATSHVQIGTVNATNTGVVTFEDLTIFDVNTAGIDTDIKVRGDNDENLVYIDAGQDHVGIGTATPTAKLEVDGSIRSSGKGSKIISDGFYKADSGELVTTVTSAGGTTLIGTRTDDDVLIKGLTAGANITLTPSATDITIASTGGGGGFYGVTWNDDSTVKKTDRLHFNPADFYLSGEEPVLNFIRDAAAGEANTASNLAGDEGIFSSKVAVDLQFKSLTAGTNISLSSDANAITITNDGPGFDDIGPGFYGITWDDGTREHRTDRLYFSGDDFYLSGSEPVLNLTDIPTLTDIYLTEFSNAKEGIADILNETINSGVLRGIAITDEGGVNISWTLGEIWDGTAEAIVDTDAAGATACTDDAVNYLYWDQSGGGTALTLSTTKPNIQDNDVIAGIIFCQDGEIWEIDQKDVLRQRESDIAEALRTVLTGVIASGGVISEHAGGGAFDVDMTACVWVHDGHDTHSVSAIDSTVTNIVRWFHDGAGDWDYDTNAQIDAANYDTGTGIAGNTANQYYRSLFFLVEDKIHWVYPNTNHGTAAQAIVAADPVMPNALQGFPKLYALILRGNAAALPAAASGQWIDRRPILSGSSGGGAVSDHGELAGLADDDHTQYILVNGTRAFTGNQSLGTKKITSLGAPTAASDAARLQDVWDHSSFYGVTWNDGVRDYKTDRLYFNNDHFYLSGFEPVLNIHGLPDAVTLEGHVGAVTEYVHSSVLDPGPVGLVGRIKQIIPSTSAGTFTREVGAVATRMVERTQFAPVTDDISVNWDYTDSVSYNTETADIDFKWSGANDGDLLVLNAGKDQVGIGIAAPTAKLHVDGDIKSTGKNSRVTADSFYFWDGSSLQQEQIDFAVTTPATGDRYILSLFATYPYTVRGVYHRLKTGITAHDFYIGNSEIDGLGTVVTNAANGVTHTVATGKNNANIGDELWCHCATTAAGDEFACTVVLERNAQ